MFETSTSRTPNSASIERCRTSSVSRTSIDSPRRAADVGQFSSLRTARHQRGSMPAASACLHEQRLEEGALAVVPPDRPRDQNLTIVPAAFFSLPFVWLAQTFILTTAPTAMDVFVLEETVPLILNSAELEGHKVPLFVAVSV
jgi:hypothetical protein